MRRTWVVRVVVLAVGMGWICLPASRAQDYSYARVVRLSRADGEVFISHAGSDTWEDATANLPLQEGDAVATQDGLAEIEFENGAMGFLAENSVLQFTELALSNGGRLTRLTLTQGAGTFYANLTSSDSFRVLTLTFEVAIPSRAEFRVDAFRDGASVQVLKGRVLVSTSAGSTELEKGQSTAIHQGDPENPDVARLPEPDEFDKWVSTQTDTIQSGTTTALNYVSSPDYYGLWDLAIYGNWVNFGGYGLCWRPFLAGFSWTPYVNGYWFFNPRLGWVWVSGEPWGWMPYHYGSWLLSPTLGWVWVPGGVTGLARWQPARVNWVRVGGQTGWVAKSPEDRNGFAANLQHGIITRAGAPSGNATGPNEFSPVKQPRNATVLAEPPPDFTAQRRPVNPRPGFASQARVPPPNNAGAIVFDNRTHTFVQGNGPVPPAQPMPQAKAQAGVPRVTLPPALPAPPPTIPSAHGNSPASPAASPSAGHQGKGANSRQGSPAHPSNPSSSAASASGHSSAPSHSESSASHGGFSSAGGHR